MFNEFLPTYAVAFCTTHEKNKTRKFNIEDLIPIASLYGVIGSPYLFIRYFIVSTLYTLMRNEYKLPKILQVP